MTIAIDLGEAAELADVKLRARQLYSPLHCWDVGVKFAGRPARTVTRIAPTEAAARASAMRLKGAMGTYGCDRLTTAEFRARFLPRASAGGDS